MKKLHLLFLLILPLLFAACGDDDDPQPKDPNDMTIEEYMSEDRPFVWNGDWNDPEDPKNTNPNKDKEYNPLANTYWRSDRNPERVLHFSEDFIFYVYDYDEETNSLTDNMPEEYIINDKGYKTDFYNYVTYRIENNGQKYYQCVVGRTTTIYKDLWSVYTKFDYKK